MHIVDLTGVVHDTVVYDTVSAGGFFFSDIPASFLVDAGAVHALMEMAKDDLLHNRAEAIHTLKTFLKAEAETLSSDSMVAGDKVLTSCIEQAGGIPEKSQELPRCSR